MFSRRYVWIGFLPLIAVVITVGLALAQQLGLDRVEELEQRLIFLEERWGAQKDSASEVSAIAEIAKLTMESYESRFVLIQSAVYIASGLLVLIVGGLGFLGLREFRSATRPLKEMGKQHQVIMKSLAEAKDRYSSLADDLEKMKKEAHTNLRAAVHVSAATTYLTAHATGGHELYFRRAVRDVTRTLDEIKPTDPKLLGWAYGLNAYILKRTATVREAMESIEKAIELDPEAEASWYNAACYAAILGEEEKWIRYLGEAIRRYPSLRETARDEADFEGVRDNPEFRRLTGLE